jgi:putative alpha-1,2-mannosidase
MSFISPSQACSNAEQEIPTYDFEAVSQSSVSQFETILNRIRVDPTHVSNDTLTLFYSSVSPSVKIRLRGSYIEH